MRVKEIMKKVVTITGNHTLQEAARFMAEHGISCLVVTDGDEIRGLITERDVTKQVSIDADTLKEPVRFFMSTNMVTVDAEAHLDDAADLMTKNKVKKLPVLKEGRVAGIITSTDLISHASGFKDFSLFG